MENENVKFATAQEIESKINSSNVEEAKAAINQVLSGSLKPVEEKPVAEHTQDAPAAVEIKDPASPQQTISELEAARNYAKLMEEENKSKVEQELRKRVELENKLKAEEEKRVALEARIKQIVEQPIVAPQSDAIETPDEFLPDYAKKHEEEIRQLKQKLYETDTPVSDIKTRLAELEGEKKQRDELEKRKAAELAREMNKSKLHSEISQLQEKFEDLKTNRPFVQISDDFLKFRKDLSVALKCKTEEEIDTKVMQYFDPTEGKQIQEEVSRYGIKPPDESDKLLRIAEYIDTKNGVKYDPVLKRYVDITDSFGNKVRYRSLEDVYKINNFNDAISAVKKQTTSQVSQLINRMESSTGGRIQNNETAEITNKVSEQQVEQLLSANPATYWNDPKKRQIVREAYQALNLDPPTYRNQKI